jgi:alpha-glucosidase
MKILHVLLFILCFCQAALSNHQRVSSPDEKIRVEINVDEDIQFQILFENTIILSATELSMNLRNEKPLGRNARLKTVRTRKVDHLIKPDIREKCSEMEEVFNELELNFEDKSALVFRVYNEGIAYHFVTNLEKSIIIERETLQLEFNQTDRIFFQRSGGFASPYESPYEHMPVNQVSDSGLVCLPALVQTADGIKILLTESDLTDYPGMWLRGTGSEKLSATFAGYPLEKSSGDNPYQHGRVIRHADYIARTKGNRSYPWRVFIIAKQDKELLTSNLVYLLATPLQLNDVSWIKPGIVTFDWWARRNIYGVNFKAGINTATAKYFIDFAAEFGLEYFLFDDGWTDNRNILNYNPALDMEEITAYAKDKKVGLMVWLIWSSLDRQTDAVFDMLQKWDVKGIKVDFMNRDDQEMVNFYHKIASEAAKRKMVIDFHGAYKPAGLRRAYPNVLTREALIEFEYNGWTDYANPEHHNLLPFIRMVAGPMDYIPGTMNNAQKKDFRKNGDHPMGQGTRAHALALFVVLESPMQMLPDSPSDYYKERTCMEFISKIPVEWDETRVLEAKLGDYVVIARRNGNEWFVSAITDWDARDFDISLDFLDEEEYTIELIKDGLNADLRAIDYVLETDSVSKESRFHLQLAPGGGWIARIYKK